MAQGVAGLAGEFAAQRRDRQRRRHLEAEDFRRLAETGFPLTGVPAAEGGLWESVARSTRPVAELLRTLAGGDPAVALVSAMHPAVLSFWLATPRVGAAYQDAWEAQRRSIFGAVRDDGAWWGTITSEPGSGGDVARTVAVARPVPGAHAGDGPDFRLSGAKHFGSGSGITSYMITTARPAGPPSAGDGETPGEPDWFFLDVRGAPWDGATGMRLLAEWDGHGMAATQSHAFDFRDYPATRFAWPGHLPATQRAAGPFVGCLFTAVIVGIVEAAGGEAQRQLAPRRDGLRAYERVEWARAQMEGWLVRQAYEGMLRAVEGLEGEDTPGAATHAVLQGKTAAAELAEAALGRLCRVLGGGTYGRGSPFGHWLEDVRALGFLRPPWGLAYDRLIEGSWA